MIECNRRKQNAVEGDCYINHFNTRPKKTKLDEYNDRNPLSSNNPLETTSQFSITVTSEKGNVHRSKDDKCADRYLPNVDSHRTVLNPYKNIRSQRASNGRQHFNPRQGHSMNNQGIETEHDDAPASYQYASDVLNETSHKRRDSQHPHRSGLVRHQRQFGTAAAVSMESTPGVIIDTDKETSTFTIDIRSTTPPSNACVAGAALAPDDKSESSRSSSDDDIISFAVFGSKR